MKTKANGQRNPSGELDSLAVCLSCPCSSDGQSACLLSLRSLGSNPARGTRLISPTHSANCEQGLASGEPKAEFTRLTAILDLSPEESKVQDDVPQLRGRVQESRKTCRRVTTVSLLTMRENVQ